MIGLATRYFDLGQRTFDDALRVNTICFDCAARLTRIQAGAAGALFAPPLLPPGFPGAEAAPHADASPEARMAALMKCVDETYATLAAAQSQLRAVVQHRWSELASEMTAALEPAADERERGGAHRARPGAKQAEPRLPGNGARR
jgi:hypothetical protein